MVEQSMEVEINKTADEELKKEIKIVELEDQPSIRKDASTICLGSQLDDLSFEPTLNRLNGVKISPAKKKSEKPKNGQPKTETSVKKLQIRSWSLKVSSLDFGDIKPETPKSTLIKLKPNPQKSHVSNIQVFIDSDVFFVVDFHAHICLKNVAGYLFGLYNSYNNSVQIVEAFPVLEIHSTDPTVVEKIRVSVENLVEERRKHDNKFYLIGRYISNHDLQPDPSINDVIIHEDTFKQFDNLLYDDLFYTFVISPYYDPKSVANIETYFNVYYTSSTTRCPDPDIGLPIKCEYKKILIEISETVLKKIELLSYVIKKTGIMMNMSLSYWHEISLQLKMMGSLMQHVKNDESHHPLTKFLMALTSA